MDKKQTTSRSNLNSQCAKGSSSESRKSQDATGGKQWPRSGRPRQPSSTNFTFNNNPSTTTNKPEQYHGSKPKLSGSNFDKRYRGRGSDGYQRSAGLAAVTTAPGGTRLDDYDAQFEAEMNSVYQPGSKKQNLNHLLNFNYAPRDRGDPGHFVRSGNQRNCVRKIKYNKEQFLQATCQFVVRADLDWTPFTVCPDTLVDWQFIEQVHVQTAEEPQCPICLFHPVAGKMTRCGHIYCWPCVLHYLALSDKAWRKCPICYEAIHVGDLKSAISMPHASYNVGDYVNLQLMCREKGSLNVSKAAKPRAAAFPHLFGDADDIVHSKLILAGPAEVLTIIERERNELICQLSSDGPDCPESIFIQQSLDLLQERQTEVLKLLKKTESKTINVPSKITAVDIQKKFELLDTVELSIPTEPYQFPAEPYNPDFIIDEESNLMLHDIDITPAVADAQHFYFYQAADGQLLYMHSINVRMLQAMYGSLDRSPNMIRGKVVQKESCSMTEVLRKRLKYLQHLPVTSQFEVVEIGLDPTVVSEEVLAKFKEELSNRQKMRQRRAKEERKREKQIDEVNERQIGKIISRSANIDVTSNQQFPMCQNFESPPYYGSNDPPPGVSLSPSGYSDLSSSPGVTVQSGSSGPSFAKMLTTPQKAEFWPTLGPTKLPNFIDVAAAKKTLARPAKQTSESEYDDVDEIDGELAARAPEFKSSFGTAIAEAMFNKSLDAAIGASIGSSSGGKKKKNKKTILFSTGGRSFNGN